MVSILKKKNLYLSIPDESVLLLCMIVALVQVQQFFLLILSLSFSLSVTLSLHAKLLWSLFPCSSHPLHLFKTTLKPSNQPPLNPLTFSPTLSLFLLRLQLPNLTIFVLLKLSPEPISLSPFLTSLRLSPPLQLTLLSLQLSRCQAK